MKTVNILDVARNAGISKSTVSRVLNNQPHVKAETREKIYRTIHEMNFYPNHSARSIVFGKTSTVGLLVPNLTSPFYVQIVEGIVDEISSRDYGLLLYKSEGKDEQFLKNMFHQGKTDGIVTITPRFREKDFVEAFQHELPFVLINHRNTQIDAPYVCFDNYQGGYMAGKYLVDLGHSEIACFSGRLTSQSTKDRFNGFKKALRESGVQLDDRWTCVKGIHFEHSTAETIQRWFVEKRIPTAFFAYNDLTATEIIAVLRELNVSVPDEISVMGFDNIRMAQYTRPPLTTINQSMEMLGRKGARMLLDIIQGVDLKEKQLTIEPEIIIRESCDKPNLRRNV
jgi:LacI family transcriptional regulator